MKLICEHCQKEFEAKRLRRCCDRACASRVGMQVSGRKAWRTEETQYLIDIGGRYPLEKIVRRMQNFNKKHGWAARSPTAVQIKLRRLGISRKCIYDNFNRFELARILDISPDRVRSWTRRFGLPFRKGGALTSISISSFRLWAYAHPELLTGIEAERLDWLMNDLDFCLEVALPPIQKTPKRKKFVPITVKRKDTGAVYPSLRDAAEAAYVHRSSLGKAIAQGRQCAGIEWEIVEYG